jgi:hypothetical protein
MVMQACLTAWLVFDLALVQFWQDSAHKMIDAKAALIRRWTGGGSTVAKKHDSPAAKKKEP